MSHYEGNYEPLGVSGLGSTGLTILYRMVETLSGQIENQNLWGLERISRIGKWARAS